MNQVLCQTIADHIIKQVGLPAALAAVGEQDVPPFPEWCEGILVDGHAFSFKGREYLIQPYNDDHPYIIKRKSTQGGGTVEEELRAIYALIYGNVRNVLYYFPSKTDVTDFSQARVGPLAEENPKIAKYVQETNRANLRQFGGGFLHLLGMRSAMAVKQIPAGLLIFDEFDEAPQLSFDKAMERIGGILEGEQEPPKVRLISNPSLPDYGVCRLFDKSDQHYWTLKCPHCGEQVEMVGAFEAWVAGKGPPPLLQVNGKTIRACTKCQRELDPTDGEWVAKYPGRDKRGYQYTQLWSQTIMHRPEVIMEKFHTAMEIGNLQDFFNLVIGIGYVEAENRLSEEEVLALCGSEGILTSSMKPCFMGVDDNGQELHVTIGRKLDQKWAELIFINTVKEWDELDRLMESFNIARAVVDGMPDPHESRKFSERFKGRVFRHFYNRHQKGAYAWDEKDFKVSTNRTESLTASHSVIRNQEVVLPKRSDITKEFARHCHNTAKKLEEEEETDRKTGMKRKTGNKVYVWVKLGPDDYRHSFNYFCIAWLQALKGVFSDVGG